MPPRRKGPVLTQRERHRANPITLRITQDDYDRAQVLAQLAADLASDPRIGRSVLFKGGAVLQMGHQSPASPATSMRPRSPGRPSRKGGSSTVRPREHTGRCDGYRTLH